MTARNRRRRREGRQSSGNTWTAPIVGVNGVKRRFRKGRSTFPVLGEIFAWTCQPAIQRDLEAESEIAAIFRDPE